MKYKLINMDSVEYERDQILALDDELLKSNLGVHDPALVNATFTRSLSQDGETTYIRALVRGAGKGDGNVYLILKALEDLPESKNPMIQLQEELEGEIVDISKIPQDQKLALMGLIENVIEKGKKECETTAKILDYLVSAKAKPSEISF